MSVGGPQPSIADGARAVERAVGRDLGQLDEMVESAHGFTCRPCLLSGVPQTRKRNGSPLSEADRCPACMETVCDRHPKIANGADTRHGVRAHGAPMARE